ncbi:MAG: hydrolase [Acidobacteria bacterium]|nr:hydrolase [Acidobacteriota bacterium]
MELKLDPATTALVVIDLQKSVVARETWPRPASEVVAESARLAARFRTAGAFVVLVNVAFSPDDRDRLKAIAEEPAPRGPFPPELSELAPELDRQPSDLLITKRQWGAFYGTDLELQLRRRGITTIVLTGISTNFGVESTARDAWERGFSLVFVENGTAALSPSAHEFAYATVFPRIGLVRQADELSIED